MDKKRTTQATRVPSNVPNDYDRLPAPGALNIPLYVPRRRLMSRRNRRGRLPGWAKAIIAIGGAILAFGIVALIVAAIVFRPFFRNLEPRYRSASSTCSRLQSISSRPCRLRCCRRSAG